MTTKVYPDRYTVADIIADVIWTDEGELRGTVTEAAKALADAGLLMPDLPEPTYGVAQGHPVWTGNGGDKIDLSEDGIIGVSSRDRNAEQARDLAYRLLAAADYAEKNTDTKENS